MTAQHGSLHWDSLRERWACRFPMRVRYAETDRMGIAYNAHYLTWFEVGRTEFMRCSGLSYRAVEERGMNGVLPSDWNTGPFRCDIPCRPAVSEFGLELGRGQVAEG